MTPAGKNAGSHSLGRLRARPGAPRKQGPLGLHELETPGSRRPALVYVPPTYRAQPPAPFALMLHGAGGSPHDGLALLRDESEQAGLLLLAPGSRGGTWDVLEGGYGPDVQCIDAGLEYIFENYAADPARLAVGGFSDGASYALSLGVTNGGLFTHVVAFSPGFMAPTRQPDSPRLFISHGTADAVLPIDACSRRLVPALRKAGYDVQYREVPGGHTVPQDLRAEAVAWLLAPG